MKTNIFSTLRAAITGFGSNIMDFFDSVADAVVGLALVPFVGLLGIILNIAINAVCSMMTFVGQGVIGMFSLDIGTGTSVFEAVLSSGLGGVAPILKMMALTLLALTYGFHIVRLMTAPPDPNDDTPLRLTAKTLVAGIMITFGSRIILIVERVFNIFFMWALGTATPQDLDFSNFATVAQLYIQGGQIQLSVSAQIAALASCLLLFFLIVMVAVQYFRYMFEVAQRYVVFGTLIFTAPLAFVLIASKTTAQSFASWLRMVGSQMFLLITNVVVLHVFLAGFSSFQSTLTTLLATPEYSDANGVATLILWCLMMFSILYIGTKLDTYLKTLGLSVIETGSGMMTQLMEDVMDFGLHPFGRSRHAMGGTHYKSSQKQKASRKQAAAQRAQAKPGQKAVLTLDKSNSATSDSINDSTHLQRNASGAELGRGIISNLSGVSQKQLAKLNPMSATMKDGIMHLSTTPNKGGQVMALSLVRADTVSNTGQMCGYGRQVFLGSTPYIAVAQGAGSHAFNTSNPSMQWSLDERYGVGAAQPVYNQNEHSTGVWRMATASPDGKTAIIHEWAPTSCYRADAGLAPQKEHIGSLDYWSYDVVSPITDDETQTKTTRCGVPLTALTPVDRHEWLHSQFPSITNDNVSDISTDARGDLIRFQQDGQPLVMAPVADYELSPDINGTVVQATNGARYILIEDTGANIDTLFQQRDTYGGHDENTAYATPTHPEDNIGHILIDAVPDLIKVARHKAQKGER